MSRKVIAKAARYLDDKECQRPANVSCGSGRQGTLPRKVCRVPSVAPTHCWHGMLQLKARQFRAWWRRMNGRGPVSRHLQLPARRGLKHAHALESELSMLTGGVSYCRFSFHGGVKHVHTREIPSIGGGGGTVWAHTTPQPKRGGYMPGFGLGQTRRRVA